MAVVRSGLTARSMLSSFLMSERLLLYSGMTDLAVADDHDSHASHSTFAKTQSHGRRSAHRFHPSQTYPLWHLVARDDTKIFIQADFT